MLQLLALFTCFMQCPWLTWYRLVILLVLARDCNMSFKLTVSCAVCLWPRLQLETWSFLHRLCCMQGLSQNQMKSLYPSCTCWVNYDPKLGPSFGKFHMSNFSSPTSMITWGGEGEGGGVTFLPSVLQWQRKHRRWLHWLTFVTHPMMLAASC